MESPLVDSLSSLARLALAYAPARARADWLTVLALDAKLAAVRVSAREPVLAQLRYAWWRDRLQQAPADRPQGEPLLQSLASWGDAGAKLAAMVDGWEALLGDPPRATEAIEAFVAGKEAAMSALAERLQCDAAAARALARRWALADLALGLVSADTAPLAKAALAASPKPSGRCAQAMRPLAVLAHLNVRAVRKGHDQALSSPIVLLGALRVGLLGR